MNVYAVADLHGRLDLFKMIQDFLKEDDTLYVIGDVLDRGPDGWKLLKEVLKDKRCILLKGNHEDMCYRAMSKLHRGDFYSEDLQIWFNNGGYTTYDEIMEDPHGFEILPVLNTLVLQKEYTNAQGIHFIINHSGYYPYDDTIVPDFILWDRNQFKQICAKGWRGDEDTIVIHGHTPNEFLQEEAEKYCEFFHKNIEDLIDWDGESALWYAQDHKICIDTGAYFYGKALVFNLDNCEEHIFSI